MIKDIIGLQAEIQEQYDEAVKFEEAAKEIYEEARRERERKGEFLGILKNYRGGDRRNASRTYPTPTSTSKAANIHQIVLGILNREGRPMNREEILSAMVEDGQDERLPGEDQTTKLMRLSVYLTRMFKREEGPLLSYERDTKKYAAVREVAT